jgi:hypothetical protein
VIVKRILQEQNHPPEQAEENGTFELHYNPTNTDKKSIKIPVSTRQNPTSPNAGSNVHQQHNLHKIKPDDQQSIMQSRNSSINHF